MKRIYGNLIMILAMSILAFSCQPTEYKTLDEPSVVLSALAGTWKITQVMQTDADAATKGFPFQKMDLTTVFPYTDFKLVLNMNGNTPSTFSTIPGSSPKIIKLASGNWSVDDPSYPKVLTLANATDTARVVLGSYPGPTNASLKLALDKKDASGKVIITYNYVFAKQ